MSWKFDAVALGGLAVGGYLVITNLDKISAWISAQIGKPLAEAAQSVNPANPHAIQNEPFYQAGYDLGKWTQSVLGINQGQGTYASFSSSGELIEASPSWYSAMGITQPMSFGAGYGSPFKTFLE
jgi:hypothetical protein